MRQTMRTLIVTASVVIVTLLAETTPQTVTSNTVTPKAVTLHAKTPRITTPHFVTPHDNTPQAVTPQRQLAIRPALKRVGKFLDKYYYYIISLILAISGIAFCIKYDAYEKPKPDNAYYWLAGGVASLGTAFITVLTKGLSDMASCLWNKWESRSKVGPAPQQKEVRTEMKPQKEVRIEMHNFGAPQHAQGVPQDNVQIERDNSGAPPPPLLAHVNNAGLHETAFGNDVLDNSLAKPKQSQRNVVTTTADVNDDHQANEHSPIPDESDEPEIQSTHDDADDDNWDDASSYHTAEEDNLDD